MNYPRPSVLFLAFVLLSTSPLGAVHQMDAQIGRSRDNLIGDDLYATPAGQTIRLTLRSRASLFAKAQHDLTLNNATNLGSAVVRVRGSFSRKLELRVIRIDGTRRNVTAAITGSGLGLPDFGVDTEADFLIRATRRSGAPDGNVSLKFLGLLTSPERSRDTAIAAIRLK